MTKKAFITTLPSLIEIQCSSFCWFLTQGLDYSFQFLQPNIFLNFGINLMFWKKNYFFIHSKTNLREIKRYNSTFLIKIYIPITFFCSNSPLFFEGLTDELICIGEIPLITNNGTFIINGYEKIIIQQLVRCPGIYFSKDLITYTKTIYNLTIIPQTGTWLHLEMNMDQSLTICIDKSQKFNICNFFELFSFSKVDTFKKGLNFQNFSNYFENESVSLSLKQKASFRTIFKNHIFTQFFYNLGPIGRYKLTTEYAFLALFENQEIFTLKNLFQIIKYFQYLITIRANIDDFDSLKFKNVSTVGEILNFQFLASIKRLQRQFTSVLLDTPDPTVTNLISLFDSTLLISSFRTFFVSSRLVQFLDQTNILADLSHRRRLLVSSTSSAVNVSTKMRDIHSSFFGRLCPIETAEGNNIGLSAALSVYARTNKYGFIETPFFLLKDGFILFQFPAIYLTTYEEELYKVINFDVCVNSQGKILKKFLNIRYKNNSFICLSTEIQLISISSLQNFSIGTALIPFLEHNDSTRALMGSNMQRQAIPLLFSSKPIIGTGLELQVATSLGLKSFLAGHVFEVTHNCILISSIGNRLVRYFLQKFIKSNQNTCISYSPLVWKGEFVFGGQIIAETFGTKNGELSLGQNLLLAYMSWNGYNFEDSILINECLISLDVLTSLTISTFTINIQVIPNRSEFLTADLPFESFSQLKTLSSTGIIKKGTFIKPFDLLVGKVTRFTQDELFFYLLFSNISINKNISIGYNTSIYATSKCYGRVLDVITRSRENTPSLPLSIRHQIIIFFAQIRKIQVGDKLAGRHGNKGIISKILSSEDMPYLPNGKSIDLILNPLGVPSRMNIGQLFEGLLGFACSNFSTGVKILPFDEIFGDNSSRLLIHNYLYKAKKSTKLFWLYNKIIPGKIILRDGKTGNTFDNPILICKSYILKLIHLSAEKLTIRSTGPYSLITQQPVKGKSIIGGQRFGEMEVWALEAFGATYTLQEMLTLKSDDIIGRTHILESIMNNNLFLHLSLTESFKHLILELKALGLKISFYNNTTISF
uniref:DNA-directed RNA polymerase subunit beta n=1 Tax=Pteridomonas danica TaxID=38822 RepID=A0A7T1C536_9STRA|nr:RNA polymerase beta subunit [Pteridomonas danica]QPM99307.1 RNA polymerase beta subunit [Pteridomonas danica]